MAQNKTMAIKHAKARKDAMREVLENNKVEMCAKILPQSKSVAWNMGYKPYSICNHA